MRSDDTTNSPRKKKTPERRNNFRVTCPITVAVSLEGNPAETWSEARVLDLSLGGLRVALELEEELPMNLTGRECSLRFRIGGKNRTLKGRFIGVYASPEKDENIKKTLEAGIRFEGLSVEDQFILVDIFGKTRSPLFF